MNIIIAGNCPLITYGYGKCIAENFNDCNHHEVFLVKNYNMIPHLMSINNIDLLILDYETHFHNEVTIDQMKELVRNGKALNPNIKIIVVSNFSGNYILYKIFKNVNPEGLLIKKDLYENTLIDAIKVVMNDKIYYSPTFCQLVRKQFWNDYMFDEIDRKIIYLLSTGARTKDIAQLVYLSVPAVEKRKQIIKKKFFAKGTSSFDLVISAQEHGFL